MHPPALRLKKIEHALKIEELGMRVPFALPDCGDEEIQEIAEVMKSGWLTTASRCAQFEQEFAEFIGSKYALGVSSGTAALHLGLEALGIGEGDKVLVPTFTFTATAEVVRYLQADPIFIDSDPGTFCITVEQIENAITNNESLITNNSLKAIIPVHFGGHPCDMDAILDFAKTNGLGVLEDASHALPTKYNGRLIGTYGDATCFSFYANKTITTGEGGMVCTDNDETAKRVKVMRLHGIDHDVWDRFSIGASWEYDVIAPGYKYNMPDISAALGIQQLRKARRFRDRRQQIAETYYEELKEVPGLISPRIRCAMEDHSWYLFNVLIDPEKTKNGINRNGFISEMTKRGIGTSVHYKPLHRMTYYKNKYGLRREMFPNAEWVFERCVCLPIFSAMTDDQLEYVIENVKNILL
jgi:dTDP-4-amino-4,6-dideoxygalactose transaminase